MKLHINCEPYNIANASAKEGYFTLTEALQKYLPQKQQNLSFAVALNSNFVNKSQYESTKLKDGDSIDVLFPIHGG